MVIYNKLVNVEVRIYHNDACLIVCVISLSDNGSSFADNQPTRKFINVNKIKSKILNLFVIIRLKLKFENFWKR